jgi:ketosteroid isomerase-like protein
MSQSNDELLEANAAFYAAFGAGDLTALDALWARDHEVAVLHPGWPAVIGRSAVIESWRRILEGPNPPDIACGDSRAFVQGDAGFVLCIEHLGDGILIATNVFALEDGGWRLVHHQAGPAASPSLEAEPTPLH